MKTIVNKIVLIGFLVLLGRVGNSQGFTNLDFESAKIDLGGSYQNFVTNAFPGWTVNAPYVFYDDVSLSGNSVSIMDANGYPPYPIQGIYFAFLASGNTPGNGQTISLGQTGTIPSWAQSITFWGTIGGMQVTFDGNPLSFSATGSGSHYTIYEADVSAYANQTGELLFTLPPYVNSATLDNIQFSSSPIPEPSTLSLTALGGLFLARWMRKAD